MYVKGSCFHCGIEDSLIWRVGPPEKLALCNVCHSIWETSGNLDSLINLEDAKDAQRNHGALFTSRSSFVGHDQIPFVFGSSEYIELGSGVSMFENNTQTQNLEATNEIPWKKRSIPEQVLSPSEKLQQQLYIAMEEQSNDEEDPESVLIFEHINKYIPENEIGLGCMLLKPPPSSDGDSKREPNAKSSIAIKAANITPSDAKDFEQSIKNSSQSSEDGSSTKSKPLTISTPSTGELGNNNQQHPMVTRSRVKERDPCMLLRDTSAYGPSREDEANSQTKRPEVTFLHKRIRGRPRKSQGQSTGTSNVSPK